MIYISHLRQTTQSGQFLNRAVGDALLNAMGNTNSGVTVGEKSFLNYSYKIETPSALGGWRFCYLGCW